ncbi:Clp protease N-terminal domain-containing protein [Nocardia jejuensis]|uniref:Clp protease N-terminal domain-containing protein n=1 Tax=Nocardia jejuensis TaxID=328049 RepID=UPI0008377948|nr:Clp protease N-terminal domain-containing protein [Nocardia jejuensis]
MTDPIDARLFTTAARAVLESAIDYAASLGAERLEPAHVLLRLTDDETPGIAPDILAQLRIDTSSVRHRIAESIRPAAVAAEHPPTADAWQLIEPVWNDNPVPPFGTDHLLTALVVGDSPAAAVLTEHGITSAGIDEALDKVLRRQCYGCAEHAGRANVVDRFPSKLPDDLLDVLERVERLRIEKGDAVDAGDFDQAARVREAEKRAVADVVAGFDESRARARLRSALNEILQLRVEVDVLARLLHEGHGRPPSH